MHYGRPTKPLHTSVTVFSSNIVLCAWNGNMMCEACEERAGPKKRIALAAGGRRQYRARNVMHRAPLLRWGIMTYRRVCIIHQTITLLQ